MVDTTGNSAVSVTSTKPAGTPPDKSKQAPEDDASAVQENISSSPQDKSPENDQEAGKEGKEGTEIGNVDEPTATDVPDDSEAADTTNAEHDYEDDEEEFHSDEEESHSDEESEDEYEDSEEAEDESEEAEDEESEEMESEEETVNTESTGDVNEYRESDDGYIHLNEKQKSKIRELTQPDEVDDIHLGFTKQGKPIIANPYYKYALRLRDVADVATPKTPPVTQTRASRPAKLIHREESSLLPAGPSMELEKIKEQFCEWLSSLGSKRNMSVTKERLEELFSLGLETNMVVRPPDVRMVRAGQTYHTPSQEDQQHQQRGNDAPTDEQHHKRVSSVAFCRSPSLTYYPDLKRRWELMAMKSEMPTWQPAYHPVAPPPAERVHYGEWYIPIKKWTPLVGDSRLTPPETEEARQLRKREQMNFKLTQVLSKSHALSALREYIRLCQAQGGSAYVPTPNMMCDVDALLVSQADEKASAKAGPSTVRPGRTSSRSYTVRLQVAKGGAKPSTSRRQTVYIKQYRRPTYAPEREPMRLKPPPMYRPTKTKPGRAFAPKAKKKRPKKPAEALNATAARK